MAVSLERNVAGRDLRIEQNSYYYMISRGPFAHRDFLNRPGGAWGEPITGRETVENLRAKLIVSQVHLDKPQPIRVTGSLFPCALLSSGWWDQDGRSDIRKLHWHNEIQEWLFHGFDLWGPSWDFSWDFDHWESSRKRPHFVAQLGAGDEANSIPVLVPGGSARRLQDHIDAKSRWGGVEAEIVAVLGHREHFREHIDEDAIELFGGLLDYCLWIDESNPKHGIYPLGRRTDVYSGYLWRCVAPHTLKPGDAPSLEDVYFIWEHTNFASKDAVAYNVDALEQKQHYLERKLGKLTTIQKSSFLVPGETTWSQQDIYAILQGKSSLKL